MNKEKFISSYKLPEGYLDLLEELMWSEIGLMETTLNRDLKESLNTPTAYFSDLDEKILTELSTHELEANLKSIIGKNPGLKTEAPLQKRVVTETENPTNTKNKTGKLRLIPATLKYAAVAAVLVVSLSIFNGFYKDTSNDLSFNEMLENTEFSEDELEYLDMEALEDLGSDLANNNEITDEETLEFFLQDEEYLLELSDEYLDI